MIRSSLLSLPLLFLAAKAASTPTLNSLLEPYNTIYIGDLTEVITADSGADCSQTVTIPNWSFWAGPIASQTNRSLSRAAYDDNPFFFMLQSGYKAGYKGSLDETFMVLRSSADSVEAGTSVGTNNQTKPGVQAWKFSTTKASDGGLDISGRYVTKFSGNNYRHKTCYITYYGNGGVTLNPAENYTMTGHITSNDVSISVTSSSWQFRGTTYSWVWSFKGTYEKRSAKLAINGDSVSFSGGYDWDNGVPLSSTSSSSSSNSTGSGSGSSTSTSGSSRAAIVSPVAMMVLVCLGGWFVELLA